MASTARPPSAHSSIPAQPARARSRERRPARECASSSTITAVIRGSMVSGILHQWQLEVGDEKTRFGTRREHEIVSVARLEPAAGILEADAASLYRLRRREWIGDVALAPCRLARVYAHR